MQDSQFQDLKIAMYDSGIPLLQALFPEVRWYYVTCISNAAFDQLITILILVVLIGLLTLSAHVR